MFVAAVALSMNKFSEGVPIYRKQREVINNYDLVFLDGPHKTFDVLKELVFFGERLTNQGFIIFDDYTTYNFDLLIKVAELINIKPMHIMENKIVMRKY